MAASLSSNEASGGDGAVPSKAKMPITVLSGFLGAGKTSFLQHIIKEDGTKKRFGLVVNDMANVNVDSKLIRTQTTGDSGIDTMELQNGCVCCTLAEDLMASVSKLVNLAEVRGEPYDHIVVECSGIAEPRKIRDLFQEAEDYSSYLVSGVQLDTLVTVVDASVFFNMYGSAEEDLMGNRALAVADDDEEGMIMLQNGEGQRRVTELLLEQVECADVVLINKCDLLQNQEQVDKVKRVISRINPNAEVKTCVRGELEQAISVLGSAKAEGAASWGILDEHRKMVSAVETANCDAPGCTDPSHNHGHGHDHSHDHASHNHDHDHKHHDSHDHDHDSSCSDPSCSDPAHDHNHDHGHSHDHKHTTETETTAKERFGITSFVYKRRRPFHPVRFSQVLQGLGKLSISGMSELDSMEEGQVEDDSSKASAVSDEIKANLLRSKGFVWMGTSAAAAYFMSHAGQFLELVVLGRWWADIPKEDWPTESIGEIEIDFDPSAPAAGDRRQEIVFIGQFGSEGSGTSQASLVELLDSCLLTDAEWAIYEQTAPKGEEALREVFFPPQ
jgi:G3E family GTPase